MIIIAQNLRELADSVVYLRTNCNHRDYPTEFQTYDEAWDSLRQSLNHLESKLGVARRAQLCEMTAQAKTHYDGAYGKSASVKSDDPDLEGIKLGSWLMQDIEFVVKGKSPFAYPEGLYRWPR